MSTPPPVSSGTPYSPQTIPSPCRPPGSSGAGEPNGTTLEQELKALVTLTAMDIDTTLTLQCHYTEENELVGVQSPLITHYDLSPFSCRVC